MKVQYINPFIQAAVTVFKDFVGVDVQYKTPFLYKESDADVSYDISGLIGLAGEVTGVVVVSMPKLTALKMVSNMIGSEIKIFDDNIVDSIGEIVNIIAGNAKKGLENFRIIISLPSIIKGPNHKIAWMSGVPVICIPFESQYGPFYIFICMRELLT